MAEEVGSHPPRRRYTKLTLVDGLWCQLKQCKIWLDISSREEAEPWLSQGCVWPFAQSRAPDSPTCPTIRQEAVLLSTPKEWPLPEIGALWHHVESKSASKLATCPLSLSRRAVCPSGTKECWFPCSTSSMRWREWGRADEGEEWAPCGRDTRPVVTAKVNIEGKVLLQMRALNQTASWVAAFSTSSS